MEMKLGNIERNKVEIIVKRKYIVICYGAEYQYIMWN